MLAQIQVQQQVARVQAEAEEKADELMRREAEAKARMAEEAAKAREAQMEREQYLSLKEARLAAEAEEKRQKQLEAEEKAAAAKLRKEQAELEKARATAEARAKADAAKQEKELYLSMQEVRAIQKKKQKEEEERMEKLFAEQERQAKQAEQEQRAAVLKARQAADPDAQLRAIESTYMSKNAALQQQKQLLASPGGAEPPRIDRSAKPPPPPPGGSDVPAINRGAKPSFSGAVPAAAAAAAPASTLTRGLSQRTGTLTGKAAGQVDMRASRPQTEAEAVHWWRSEEAPRNAGRDARGRLQPWIHGIISREDSEQLLAGKPDGAYLVRVSGRIWGYTISFVEGGKVKHFLVDVDENKLYTVFSASPRSHPSLDTLISYHAAIPISKRGTLLSTPVGERSGNASMTPLVN